MATYTITLPAKSNSIYVTYAGDQNCASSTSTAISLSIPAVETTSALTANYTTALQGANEIFTTVVSSTATTTNTNPGTPTGTVTFYDTFGGVQTTLGTSSLTASGINSSLATFQTTGLKAGIHEIVALYNGTTAYAASTATTMVVTIEDFTLTMAPASSTTVKGQTVTALATVAAEYGFSGSVVLGCTPPSGSETTCSFSPAVLTGGGGVATLTITTTAATTSAVRNELLPGGGFALAGMMLGLLLPGKRRRRLTAMLSVMFATAVLGGAIGCTTVRSNTTTPGDGGSGGNSATSGTPSGALQFTISAAGTDGRTTNLHSQQFQVTVQ